MKSTVEMLTNRSTPGFPIQRLRRLRRTRGFRDMVRETILNVADLIYPIFITHDYGQRRPIPSMPDIFQFSLDMVAQEIEEAANLGIVAVMLFGLPAAKDDVGSEAYYHQGVIQKGIGVIKSTVPEIVVITDVCLCEYTNHGHCGVLDDGSVDNDKTLELLSRTALSHAQAGADMVAPSNMMDGTVTSIRSVLDDNGFDLTPIMAYAAKYASSFYGPFRDAAGSTPAFGDRQSYQLDPCNAREALLEMELDIDEGADIIMVKPAMSYLDIVAKARETFRQPLAAYNVSGEYAMVKAASKQGWLDEKLVIMEILTGIKRAGADLILSYHAKEVAGWLKKERLGR